MLPKGFKFSEESKLKMSISHKGHVHTEEQKLKISNSSKGKHLSKESKLKISAAKKGKPSNRKGVILSEETRRKMSNAQKGRISNRKGIPHTEEHKLRIGLGNKGKHHSEETKKKFSLIHGGTGIPYENTEYGAEFDNQLKEQVRFRDKYTCQICGCSQLENGRQLDVHHKDYDKLNNTLNNLISLCHSCHSKTNSNREYWEIYFKIKLTNFNRAL